MGGSISADIEGRTWKQFSDGVVTGGKNLANISWPGNKLWSWPIYISMRLDLWANLNDRFFFFLDFLNCEIANNLLVMWFVTFEHNVFFLSLTLQPFRCYFYDVIGFYSVYITLFIFYNRYFQILLKETGCKLFKRKKRNW